MSLKLVHLSETFSEYFAPQICCYLFLLNQLLFVLIKPFISITTKALSLLLLVSIQ